MPQYNILLLVHRIEDTDQARSTRESENAVLEDLTWLGIQWDEGAAFPFFVLENRYEAKMRIFACSVDASLRQLQHMLKCKRGCKPYPARRGR